MKRINKEDELLKKEIASTFKNSLLKVGISNSDIIQKTGIMGYTVSRIFSNDPIISIENAIKIARAFNLNLNFLFGLNSDVPVIDESIEGINKKTRLSYNSIENLISINEMGQFSFMSALNEILSYEELPLLLSDFEKYFNFTNQKKFNVIIPLDEFVNGSGDKTKSILEKFNNNEYRLQSDRDIENSILQSINDHFRKIRSSITK